MLNVTIDEDSPELVIPEKVKRTLRDQAINEDGPGTILRDFETLLAFIGEDGLNTAGKYCFLPQGKLDELNQRMSRPRRTGSSVRSSGRFRTCTGCTCCSGPRGWGSARGHRRAVV